ncbi:hypothetical protein AAKU58_000735 [Oxalobacteraceae bacterium GrIS 1.18]
MPGPINPINITNLSFKSYTVTKANHCNASLPMEIEYNNKKYFVRANDACKPQEGFTINRYTGVGICGTFIAAVRNFFDIDKYAARSMVARDFFGPYQVNLEGGFRTVAGKTFPLQVTIGKNQYGITYEEKGKNATENVLSLSVKSESLNQGGLTLSARQVRNVNRGLNDAFRQTVPTGEARYKKTSTPPASPTSTSSKKPEVSNNQL